MASLTKSQLQVIARAAEQRLPRVSFNASWKKLYRLWDIGEPDGAEKYLYLTSNDYVLLRNMAQVDSGLDILALDFDVSRQQMSQLSANEKYANISPEADYVLIKLVPSVSQSLVTGLVADLVSVHHCSLRLKVDNALALCQQLNVANLVVVENLDSFDNFFDYVFATDLQAIINNCVVLYRGSHDHSPAGRKRFLHQLSSSAINIIGFTDLDPAGLMIANTLESCHSMLVPTLALESPEKLLAITQINSTADFHKQHKQWAYLNRLLFQSASTLSASQQSSSSSTIYCPQWLTLVHWLGRNNVSIKQQHMLANSLPLSLLNIRQ
ncbi:DUF7281 domain-containing protein [Shewanella polaris]|uniref:DUF7281 domain-containing protein n=1 Tax=Shewanella polaris TaxID=2588449 RepID=A0A4Y5YBA7_9GAMM|nr:hypothetical protein [Shewanella polaris]QDE29945.1 hypothetical protein FH971_02535 [Shewanella polaris]